MSVIFTNCWFYGEASSLAPLYVGDILGSQSREAVSHPAAATDRELLYVVIVLHTALRQVFV